ncbi:helix-turn-helix domain-containing protein [Mesoflavibacter sp. CH_XMU1422-2]|jgi:excisionase family DNA binding protein|uniref:helix-turn-helix domain-containing protein n=1 Tax=Mesoflavibacter sp. CH_XMU1422-2 TaxID=3107770 RepID=UPI00300BF685
MENPFEIINNRLERIERLLENISNNSIRNEANINLPKIMTLKQLTSYLDVSKSYLYKLTSTNSIPHSKRGKRIYFDIEVINNWVLENKIWTQKDIEEQVNNYLMKNHRKF